MERDNLFNNSNSSVSSSDEEFKSINYNLFKGITKESFNTKKSKLNEKENNLNNILLLRNKLAMNTKMKMDQTILNLPEPKNKLIDKHEKTKYNEFYENKNNLNKLTNLQNPDDLTDVQKSKNIQENNDNYVSINQNQLIDKNWETKYLGKILKKEVLENSGKNEEKEIPSNKISGNKRKRDKKVEDDLTNDNEKSKYSKISTRKKYGW